MTIKIEGGRESRTDKSAKRLKLEKAPPTKQTKKAEPKSAKPTKDKQPKDATQCDLCGATGAPLQYANGNTVCETCAQKAQPGASNVAAAEKPAHKSKAANEIAAMDAIVPRSLADLSRSYEAQMQKDEKTPATIAGYVNDLAVALHELGEATLVADVTPKRIAAYFECDAVTLLRSGGKKSQLSIDKTRRVLRLALEHAVELGWIAATPVPQPSKD